MLATCQPRVCKRLKSICNNYTNREYLNYFVLIFPPLVYERVLQMLARFLQTMQAFDKLVRSTSLWLACCKHGQLVPGQPFTSLLQACDQLFFILASYFTQVNFCLFSTKNVLVLARRQNENRFFCFKCTHLDIFFITANITS